MTQPFFTPIFDRAWVEEMLKKIAKEHREKEIKYILDEDYQEYEE